MTKNLHKLISMFQSTLHFLFYTLLAVFAASTIYLIYLCVNNKDKNENPPKER